MIPKKIHFIYGLTPDFGGIPFNFAHWVGVRSAQRCNPDYEIHFWYEHKPSTAYFRDLEADIVLHQVHAPESIFGNPIPHFAHRADVLRLQTLLQHGGIYLDVDTITVKPFDELLDNEVFMARVKNSGQLYGLCNAVMGGVPGAPFFATWLEAFRDFRSQGYDQFYDEFACEYPLRLSEQIPGSIQVLDEHAFFVPDMTPSGLAQLFVESGDYPHAWCHHLWEKNAIQVLTRFNERNISALQCTYSRYISRFLQDDCDRIAAHRAERCREQVAARTARLNIGCGSKFDESAINCDIHRATGADLLFDANREPWPFPDNCVEHVELSHVLEHFPGDVANFFKELYRVGRDGCTIDIRVPHPRHDWFLQDPTHNRPWLASSFLHLDRKICTHWFLYGHTETPLALYWDVDFQMLSQEGSTNNLAALQHLEKLSGLDQSSTISVFNNLASETHVILRIRKPLTE